MKYGSRDKQACLLLCNKRMWETWAMFPGMPEGTETHISNLLGEYRNHQAVGYFLVKGSLVHSGTVLTGVNTQIHTSE